MKEGITVRGTTASQMAGPDKVPQLDQPGYGVNAGARTLDQPGFRQGTEHPGIKNFKPPRRTTFGRGV